MNPPADVRSTCGRVMAEAMHVSIDSGELETLAHSLAGSAKLQLEGVSWDSSGWHYCADAASAGPLTCQYVFVLDTLNFCFWPSSSNLEYDNIATALKEVLEKDSTAFEASRLAVLSPQQLATWIPLHDLPELEERALRLNELGAALQTHFQGLAANLVAAANGSAVSLVSLVLQYLPGFRDTSVYRGRLVHFYKRAQILVGDLWAAYGKCTPSTSSPYAFRDMDQLTMFADYRVPQLLRNLGVLVYDGPLSATVDSKQEVPFGSPQEVEIRAATVVAVEQLRAALAVRGLALLAVEVDWLLWQTGEESKDRILPHHRTRTIYY
jgi:Potential Queuosine, Q, salvage protein family